MTTQEAPAQVYRVFIKASPEKIWEAITRPRGSNGAITRTPISTLGVWSL